MHKNNNISIIHLFLRFTKQNLLNIKFCNCFLYDILQNNPQDISLVYILRYIFSLSGHVSQ